MDVATPRTWRKRLYVQLDPRAWPRTGLSPLNQFISAVILLSVALTVLQTEPTIVAGRKALFSAFDGLIAFIFALEYAGRVWASAESPDFGPGLRGKLKFVRSPAALLDLVVLVALVATLGNSEVFLLRVLRLARILMLARLGRFSQGARYLAAAIHNRRYELGLVVGIALLLLLISATMLYLVEGKVQPEAFGSIPRAMWWSVTTLTTVGYGDTYPVTVLGRIFGGLTALIGIVLIAMPTGIIAAAFSEALQRRKGGGDRQKN